MHRKSMNHIYRLVWSQVLNAWVAVAETGRGRSKGSSRKLKLMAAVALLFSGGLAQAAPAGGQVVTGAGSISQSGATTTIQQSSQSLALNWKSFNIAPQETVNFVQPSASAIAVNRIFDTSGTQILGRLNANGQVVLINPNGILFGQGAQVNVGGLVASTLDLNDASLNSAKRTFSGNGTGSVVNQGTINATGSGGTGGYVALLGNTVSNQGTITAPQGAVALGAGSAATLTFQNNSLVRMQVDQSVLNSLAENGGLIRADGGQVIMNAGAKNALLASVVNNTGVIEARTVENHAGSIILLGGMTAGTVKVGGTLDASAPKGGNGGFIETSAAHVKVADDAKITTAAAQGLAGTWLIDPQDFNIGAGNTGTVTAGTPSGNISGSTLSAALGSTSVTILSSGGGTAGAGNINVNDAVSWSANTLTLTAANNININAVMTASGTSALVMNTATTNGADAAVAGGSVKVGMDANGFTGRVDFPGRSGTGFLTINGAGYTVINSLGAQGSITGADLQGINGNLTRNYALGSNIDALATSGWNAGTGFTPLSNYTGTFDGLGHTISNLAINQPGTLQSMGLFSTVGSSGTVKNVGLVGVSVNGGVSRVGGLAGQNDGTISNVYAVGSVTGGSGGGIGGLVGYNGSGAISNSFTMIAVSSSNDSVGGLVGYNLNGSINNSYATGSVTGTNFLGGLVGVNNGGAISNSYATGAVTGNDNIGGLSGSSFGTIANSYAMGAVAGRDHVGGLVGINVDAISTSYATGVVTGRYYVGGLVGGNSSGNNGTPHNGAISAGYATGVVTGSLYVGGLTGYNAALATIGNSSYATGAVSGTNIIGGLVGDNSGTVANSRATGTVSGTDLVGGLVGNNAGTINTSSAAGAVFGTTSAGGLVGQNSGMSAGIANSHATGTVSGTTSAGGLVGTNLWGSISDSYATGTVMGSADNVGGLAGLNDSGVISNSYARGSAGGHDNVGGLVGGNTYGTIRTSYARGSATGRNNIGGLVGYGTGGAISNSSSSGAAIGTGNYVGGLVGSITGFLSGGNVYGTISDSFATGAVSGTDYVGGLTGNNNISTISNSRAEGTVSGNNNVGGLVGRMDSGTISDSYATGLVSGNTGVGGLVGVSYGHFVPSTISNSHATGMVSGNAAVGGLVGINQGSAISSSYATGEVSGSGYSVGGLVGQNGGTISDSYATGAVSSTGDYVGGLAGSSGGSRSSGTISGGTISNSYATGVVSGRNYVGGLVGSSGGSISYGYATGGVLGSNFVGGLVGRNYDAISNSYSTGLVSGNSYVGGLVGSNYGSNGYAIISDSYATTGAVSGTGDYVGGLVGENYFATISDSYASRAVTGRNYVGGLVGSNEYRSFVSTSYATGAVSGSSYVGGLVGENDATISDSYATGAVAGTRHVGGLVGYARDLGAVGNSHYNIDTVTINGVLTHVTPYGIYNTQYLDWFNNNKMLSIASYASLPLINGYYQISSTQGLKDLLGFADNAGYKFRLTANLDLAGISNDLTPNISGWHIPYFAGLEFDGAGYTLSNLTINQPFNDRIGFIGMRASGGPLGNLGLTNISVTGYDYVGGLVGEYDGDTISNSYATGAVTGSGDYVGGLVGYNGNSSSTINTSYATVTVTGSNYVGGLVGYNGGAISESYATGAVTGSGDYVGGLVGYNSGGTISNSYATGAVTGSDYVGGLVGYNDYDNYDDNGNIIISISNTYAAGRVTGSGSEVGGLVGYSDGTVNHSFWDTFTSGQSSSAGGTGMTTAPMKQQVNFTDATSANGNVAPDWDFDSTWRIYDGHTYPLLQVFLRPFTITATTNGVSNASQVYNGIPYSGVNGITCSSGACSNADSHLFNTAGFIGTSQGAKNVGSYTLISDAFSDQQGYNITFVNGALTINKAHLTVTADNKSRLYGEVNPTLSTTVSGFVNGETASTAAGFTGAGSATTLAGLTTGVGTALITAGAGSLAASNYDFTTLVDGVLTINPAAPTPNPATPSAPVLNAISQIQSAFTVFNPLEQHQTLLISPTIGGEANTYLQEVVVVGNQETRINIGGLGPILQILNGGVNLLDNTVNVNEKDKK